MQRERGVMPFPSRQKAHPPPTLSHAYFPSLPVHITIWPAGAKEKRSIWLLSGFSSRSRSLKKKTSSYSERLGLNLKEQAQNVQGKLPQQHCSVASNSAALKWFSWIMLNLRENRLAKNISIMTHWKCNVQTKHENDWAVICWLNEINYKKEICHLPFQKGSQTYLWISDSWKQKTDSSVFCFVSSQKEKFQCSIFSFHFGLYSPSRSCSHYVN